VRGKTKPGLSGGTATAVCGGAHDWNRTSDLFLTKEVLYRLSYMSTKNTATRSMERETGIEPAPSAWKAEVLPLNYSRPVRNSSNRPQQRTSVRVCDPVASLTGVTLDKDWWREVDSNHRRRKPADLQSAPVGRLGIPPTKNGYCVDQSRMCQHLDDAEPLFFRDFSAQTDASVQSFPALRVSTSCSMLLDSSSRCSAFSCRRRSLSSRGSH
jgi:hypothetical protein